MSRFIRDFQPLGDIYIEGNFIMCEKPLRGFGRALAVATLIYDYDCLGNSGSNMGFIPKGDHAIIVKIDAGEALPFLEDLQSAQKIQHQPKERNMIVGTDGTRISFGHLSQNDKKEFVTAASDILTMGEEKIKSIFKEFINYDRRFEEVQSHLLKRRTNFLQAFTP